MRVRMIVRRMLAVSVLAAGMAMILPAPQASAVCGGGQPGEPCYCPSEIVVAGKSIPTGMSC